MNFMRCFHTGSPEKTTSLNEAHSTTMVEDKDEAHLVAQWFGNTVAQHGFVLTDGGMLP